jgi:hypothetical protein
MKTAGYHERKAFYADFVMLSFPTFVNSARVETLAPRPLSIVAGRDRSYAEPRSIHLPRTLVDNGKRAGAKGFRRETPPGRSAKRGAGILQGVPAPQNAACYSCSLWKRGTSISLALWAASRLFSRIPLKNSTSS